MVNLGIMIEGQEGVTWERWDRITDIAEDLGYDSLWRSDHLFSVMDESQRETLALWPSLTTVATRTRRIEFGQLVSPTTFRNPVHLAYNAVALDRLSAGRFWLGVGAGWNEAEHRAFGFPLPPLKERMDRFEEALKVMTLLWTGDFVSIEGQHFQLDGARNTLTPLHASRVPIIIGGGGEKRTLRLVAEYAGEWNVTTITRDDYRRKVEALTRHCEDIGRDPADIRRSLMTAHIIGRDQDELRRRATSIGEFITSLRGLPAQEVISRQRERGWIVGTTDEVIEQIRERGDWGIERIMLQTFDLGDMDALRLIANEVMPRVG